MSGGLLPPELLDSLSGLDLVARTIVRGSISGLHRSPFLGSGEDFSRHRAYQQGDDVRRLDWKLYGRTDRLHVRLYEEASNLQAMVAIDTSESMAFEGNGPVSKLRYAQFIGAALSHLMLRSGDAVGLASFGADTAFHLPPRNRPGQLHDLLLALERLAPGGTAPTADAIDRVGGTLRRRGRVVVVSDCLDTDGGASLVSAVGRLRARGDEVIVVRVATRLELGERPVEAARYYDPERPDHVIPVGAGSDAGFRDRVQDYYEGVRRGIENHGAEYVPVTTDQPLLTALGDWLRGRLAHTG